MPSELEQELLHREIKDPMKALGKATTIGDGRSTLDKLMEMLIGEEGRANSEPILGSDLLGQAATGMDQLEMGNMNPDEGWKTAIARIPLARKGEFNDYLKHMSRVMGLDEATRDAIEFASIKYPRILAHVGAVTKRDPKTLLEKLGGLAGGQGPMGPEGMSMIGIRQGMKPKDTFNTFGHELTHAAQEAWHGNKMSKLYDDAGRGMKYYDNLYEQGARKAGDNFQKKAYEHFGIEEEPGVIQKLMNYLSGGE